MDIFEEWNDAEKLAQNTARRDLAGPIADLQEIKRRAGDLEHPDCAFGVHLAMQEYMDKTLDAYLAFMASKPDPEVSALFDEATVQMQQWVVEFTYLTIGIQPMVRPRGLPPRPSLLSARAYPSERYLLEGIVLPTSWRGTESSGGVTCAICASASWC